jgi:hypothetical protein
VKDIGAAMDYWEAELIKYEQSGPPSKRLLTRFRIHQQLRANRRLSPNRFDKYLSPNESATDEDIGHLIGGAWSRSRLVINRHFFSLLPVCWLVLLVGGSLYMAIFLVQVRP